ncbi:Cof-type HAD-IIB family hydrolase [Winogradskya humida]|uniref:Hydrolase n=1 Tax=Winogradskya humida TaxID=113566 RepID=A0ABQ3ZGZ4_9ACTN|nr:Cof-type HAD-IIB family hydrolase [Actinoplanes humidus]GIE17871.1 hydrolase [Actinoplanes humidus]
MTAAVTTADALPDGPADLRLVVADMDGTLLDEHGRVPDGLWPLLDRMRERGVVFVPASGRQYATLLRDVAHAAEGMPIIAENGSYVVRDGVELSSDMLGADFVRSVVLALRALAEAGADLGVVVCGKRSAYIERTDRPFLDEAERYYAALQPVADLLAIGDDVLKIAVYDFGNAERDTAPHLTRFHDGTHRVVVSGPHWIDLMSATADKGAAVRRLQAELGITAAQTAVFGDYLNDLEMLDAADLSFAMADAHPEVLRRARYRAPSHRDHGVVTVLEHLLGPDPMAL